jgi:hypothetical protein
MWFSKTNGAIKLQSKTIKKMRTKLYKAALLTALGLSSIATAQASTSDVLLGFNDLAGPSGAQNDYVIDLGAASQFTTTTYNLNLSSSFNSTTFNTAFSADTSYLTDVAVGAVEGYSGSSPETLFQTGTPVSNLSGANLLVAASLAQSPSIGEYASSTAGGWSYYIALSPSLVSNGGQNPAGSLGNISGNPMVSLSSGTVTLNLYEDILTGSGRNATVSGFSEIGTLAVDVNAGTIIFNGITPAPEPTTCALFGGGALLLIALRNKRKHIKA